jgi:hypothetical protein
LFRAPIAKSALAPVLVGKIDPIRNQAAVGDELAPEVNRGSLWRAESMMIRSR